MGGEEPGWLLLNMLASVFAGRHTRARRRVSRPGDGDHAEVPSPARRLVRLHPSTGQSLAAVTTNSRRPHACPSTGTHAHQSTRRAQASGACRPARRDRRISMGGCVGAAHAPRTRSRACVLMFAISSIASVFGYVGAAHAPRTRSRVCSMFAGPTAQRQRSAGTPARRCAGVPYAAAIGRRRLRHGAVGRSIHRSATMVAGTVARGCDNVRW